MMHENMWCPQCGQYWTPSPVVHECQCQTERRLKESTNALQELLTKKSKATEDFKNAFLKIVSDYHDLSVKYSDNNGLALKAWENKCKLWLDVDLFSNFSVTDKVGSVAFCSIEKIIFLQQNNAPSFMADYISENMFARFQIFYNSCNHKLEEWLNQKNELGSLDASIGNVSGGIAFLDALNTKLFSANTISRYRNDLVRILKTLENTKDSINNSEQIAIAERNFKSNQDFNFHRHLELIRKMFFAWLFLGGAFLLFYWFTDNTHFKEVSQNYVQYYYYLFLWPFVLVKSIHVGVIIGKFVDENSNKLLWQALCYCTAIGLLALLYFIKFKSYKKSVSILQKWALSIYAIILYCPLIYLLSRFF